jgi:hypothetical protein
MRVETAEARDPSERDERETRKRPRRRKRCEGRRARRQPGPSRPEGCEGSRSIFPMSDEFWGLEKEGAPGPQAPAPAGLLLQLGAFLQMLPFCFFSQRQKAGAGAALPCVGSLCLVKNVVVCPLLCRLIIKSKKASSTCAAAAAAWLYTYMKGGRSRRRSSIEILACAKLIKSISISRRDALVPISLSIIVNRAAEMCNHYVSDVSVVDFCSKTIYSSSPALSVIERIAFRRDREEMLISFRYDTTNNSQPDRLPVACDCGDDACDHVLPFFSLFFFAVYCCVLCARASASSVHSAQCTCTCTPHATSTRENYDTRHATRRAVTKLTLALSETRALLIDCDAAHDMTSHTHTARAAPPPFGRCTQDPSPRSAPHTRRSV